MTRYKFFLSVEFIILCLIIPGIIIFGRFAPFMFAFLWGATLYALIIIRLYHFDGWRDIWRAETVTWDNLKPILGRWVLASLGMLVFCAFYDPERLFYIPKERPEIIPAIIFLYPLISALPQELIFCTFFFRRYRPFFGSGHWIVIASAVIFAYVHVLYINPVAPVLSLAGGVIFALTYLRHKSLALVTIEHGLYGNSLFLIGLGHYFYSGGVGG